MGLLAEVPAMLLSHPLRTISTRLQHSSSGVAVGVVAGGVAESSFTSSSSSHSNGSILGCSADLCHGASVTLLATFIAKILFWTCYYLVMAASSLYLKPVHSAVQHAVLGFVASTVGGLVEAVLVNPLRVITVRQQVYGHGIKPDDLYKNLMNGVSVSMVLVLFPCIRQSLFEYFTAYIELTTRSSPSYSSSSPSHSAVSTPLTHGVVGAMATVIAMTLTFPLQSIRVKAQARSGLSTGLYQMILDQNTSGGVHGLFNGLGTKLLSVTVHGFVFYLVKEALEESFVRSA